MPDAALDKINSAFLGDTIRWRTISGVVRETGLDAETVVRTIDSHPEIFVRSDTKLPGIGTVTSLHDFPVHSGVYVIRSRGGRVMYIGSTSDLRQRIREHLRDGGVMSGHESIEVATTETREHAVELEREYIERYEPVRNRVAVLRKQLADI